MRGIAKPAHFAFLVVLAFAWLPGQSSTGAVRHWLSVGVWPLFVASSLLSVRGGWPWLGLVGWTLITAIWSPGPGAAIATALTQLGWVAALVAGALDHDQSAAKLAPWAAIAGVIAASSVTWGTFGLFGNPDYLAAFLVGTIIYSLNGRWALAVIPQCVALWICDSLGAWLALAIAGLIHGSARWPRRTALVALGLGVMLGGWRPTTITEHIAGRAHLVAGSARVIKEAPLLGVGAGRFHGAFLDHQRQGDLWTNAYHAHNEPLHAWAEGGLLGLLLLCLPVGLALSRRRDGPDRAVVGAYAALGLVSLPLYMPGAAWILCYAVGRQLAKQRPRPLMFPFVISGFALFGASVDLAGDRLYVIAAESGLRDAAITASRWMLKPARALHLAAALSSADPALSLPLIQRAQELDPTIRGGLLKAEICRDAGDLECAEAELAVITRRSSRSFYAWHLRAKVAQQRGNLAAAHRYARRARSLRPTDPSLRDLGSLGK